MSGSRKTKPTWPVLTRLTIDAIVLATTVGGGWIACGADRTRPLVVWFDLPPAIVTIHFLIAFLLAGAAVDRSILSCNFVLHGIVRSSCHRASLLGDKVKTGHGSRKFFITTYATGPPNDVKPRRSAVIATSQTEPYRSAACFFAAMDPAPFVHESGMLQSYHHAREERIP